MARRPRHYEAFISYSHEADGPFATELQRVLNRIARPSYKWWQWWPPRVFRDQTNLAAASDLGAEIEGALLGSDNFVLLASPHAAASPWVDREVETWCRDKPRDRLFIAVTSGSLAWDDARGDFDSAQTNALPPALRGIFDAEPLWVDFTGVRRDTALTRDPHFMDAAATLAAAIRGSEKDAILGEDVRQKRRAKQLAGGAISLLTLLTVLATLAAIYAFVQRNRADERARLALSRQLSAQAVAALDVDPEQSLALAARAATVAATTEAENALRKALRGSHLRSSIDAGAPVLDTDLDRQGRLVAAALENGRFRTWDARTGKPVATHRLGRSAVETVSFSRDGRRLVAAGDSGVAVWSTSKDAQRPLATFDQAGAPFAAASSPDGRLVATGDDDGGVRLWRAKTGVLLDQLLPGGERLPPALAVSFSADGSRLVAARGSQTLVWNLGTKSRPAVQAHETDVWAVAFSPDGSHLATGDADGVAQVWNLRTGEALQLTGHEGKVDSLSFSPDGALLVTASEDETGRIWDARTGRSLAELRGHDGLVLGATFAPDGATVVTGGDDGTIRTWAVASDRVRELPPVDEETVRDVDYDPSGSRIVTAGQDLTAQVRNAESGRTLRVLPHARGVDEWVESARFSPDGRLVLTAGDDGTAKVWAVSSGRLLATLGRGGKELYDAAFSPDGEIVAAGGIGADVRLWRWRQRQQVALLRDFADRIDGVDFSPVGGLIAAAGGNTVRVWRVGESTPLAVLRTSETRRDHLTSVAFDPRAELVAAGSTSGAAWFWDVRTEELIGRVIGQGDEIADVAFRGDGKYLVTAGHAGRDGLASVWTVPGGQLVTSVRTRASQLEGAAFAPHGRDVAVAGEGGRVAIFNCDECRPLRSLVCLAASRVTPQVRARQREAFESCD